MKQYIIEKSTDQDIREIVGARLYNIKAVGGEDMTVSDGYHTMDELYEHRVAIYIALCKMVATSQFREVWRSKNHSDGEPAFGGTWFVLGINKEGGSQVTYHLPIEKWDQTEFAETLEKAPEFDGHSSADVLERLKAI